MLKVLQAPDDDEPRLVYADVLQERGDDRGEFIPLQCALAKWSARSDPARFAALRGREGALLSEHGPTWLKQAAPFNSVGHFHRGFVEQLQCLPGELLHRGLEVVAPIRMLRLDGDSTAEVAQRVMALPLGARVKELALCLVDSPVDGSLRAAGSNLTSVRQLSAEPNTIEVLDQLGWLQRLERLELPVTGQIAALLDDLAVFRPKRLSQLWLKRRIDGFGRETSTALERLWAELPTLRIRWRGVDYAATELGALVEALDPFRVQVGRVAHAQANPDVAVEEVVPLPPFMRDLVVTDAPGAATFGPPMELYPFSTRAPSTEPWERALRGENLFPRGFLPRAVPQSICLVRVDENQVPRLVAIGPSTSFGAAAFAQDIARLMSMPPAPDLLHVERTATFENARWAAFESFEGVSLWELLRLHPRLPPGLALRVLGQTARAAGRLDAWDASMDDVLVDLTGQVRLLPGFPSSVKVEEGDYSPGEERHRLGVGVEDARVAQLGTALFELLTGTPLLDVTGRSTLVISDDMYQLGRKLDRGGLPLSVVDPTLSAFEPLVERAMSHAYGERFSGLPDFADALLAHPQAAGRDALAQAVRDALGKITRTRDGR